MLLSFVAINVFPVVFWNLVIVLPVAITLDSITSPEPGALVNVNVPLDTEYAVIGSCTTPLIETITSTVVTELSGRANVVVEPSPVCTLLIIVLNVMFM